MISLMEGPHTLFTVWVCTIVIASLGLSGPPKKRKEAIAEQVRLYV